MKKQNKDFKVIFGFLLQVFLVVYSRLRREIFQILFKSSKFFIVVFFIDLFDLF